MGLAHLLQTIALVCHYLTNREAFMNNSFIAKRISSSVLLTNILVLDNAKLYPIEYLSKQLFPTKHNSFFIYFHSMTVKIHHPEWIYHKQTVDFILLM